MKLYTALSYSVSSDLEYYGDVIEDFLSSYWAIISQKKGIVTLQKHKKHFFLDSGAFSAFTKNINININEYIAFILDNKNIIKQYSALDVIGDWEKTKKNQEYMESKGLTPIPTFHYNSPIKELERMIKEYDYIALGGLVPLALHKKVLKSWLDTCFSIIKDKCKIHGFGVNALWAWERYPFYSVDSTSAFEGSRRGTISKSGKRLNPRNSMLAFSLIDRNNIKKYKGRARFMIKDNIVKAKQITKLWETRGIKWED